MPRKKQTVEEYNQMNPKAVMERLGHAKSNVSEEIYAHVNNETRKKSRIKRLGLKPNFKNW